MKGTMKKKLLSALLCAALMAPGAAFAAEGDVSLAGYRAFIGDASSNNSVALDFIESAVGTENLEQILDNYLAANDSEEKAYSCFGTAVNSVYMEAEAMDFSAEQVKAVFIAQTNLETGISKPDVNLPADPNMPPPNHFPSDEEIASYARLVINGDAIYCDSAWGIPFVNQDNRTMIPLRLVSTYLGYNTDWTEDGSVRIYNDDQSVDAKLQIGSLDFTNKGVAHSFDTVPILKNDRTYLPVRDFVELYGSVNWDNDTRTVTIYPEANYNVSYKVTEEGLMRTEAGVEQHMTAADGSEVVAGAADIVKQKVIDGVTFLLVQTKNDATNKGVLLVDRGDYMERVVEMNTTSSFTVGDGKVYYTEGYDAGPWSVDINARNLLVTDLESGETTAVEQEKSINTSILVLEGDDLVAIGGQGERMVVKK